MKGTKSNKNEVLSITYTHTIHHHHHHHHHHLVLLLLVEHRASMKNFQPLRSSAIPLTSFHVSSVSYFILYCPSSRSLRPTYSIPLRIPV